VETTIEPVELGVTITSIFDTIAGKEMFDARTISGAQRIYE